MKKKLLGVLFATLTLTFSIPASADSVLQIWDCELRDGKTAEDAEAASTAWLAAAKAMPGGSDFEVTHEYSIVGDTDPGEFYFVLSMPSFEAWGTFMDAYPGSAAAEADEDWDEVAECDGNELFASVDIG